MTIVYLNSDIDSLSWDSQIAPVSFFHLNERENAHCTRAIVFTTFYRVFVKSVSTWLSMTINS